MTDHHEMPEVRAEVFTHNPTDLPVRPKADEILLTVRPHRMTIIGIAVAAVLVGVTALIGTTLRGAQDGITFGAYDQWALIAVGLMVAGSVLLVARPRLRVTARGVWVRNILGERFYQWELVHRIAFPQGSNWAMLQLPDDEVYPVMAIQSMDKARAVSALQQVRELHGRYAPPPPEPPAPEVLAQRDAELLRRENDRPLGRLEKIDRIKAAQGAGRVKRGRS